MASRASPTRLTRIPDAVDLYVSVAGLPGNRIDSRARGLRMKLIPGWCRLSLTARTSVTQSIHGPTDFRGRVIPKRLRIISFCHAIIELTHGPVAQMDRAAVS